MFPGEGTGDFELDLLTSVLAPRAGRVLGFDLTEIREFLERRHELEHRRHLLSDAFEDDVGVLVKRDGLERDLRGGARSRQGTAPQGERFGPGGSLYVLSPIRILPRVLR